MNKRLPDAVIAQIRQLVHDAEVNNEVLDAYGVAERIKRRFPDQALATGDIVAAMLNSGLRAVELSAPVLIVDVILPPGSPSEANAIDDLAPLTDQKIQ